MRLRKPISLGLLLTYRCNASCRHCMYNCGPKWESDWIKLSEAEKIFTMVEASIQGLPDNRIGINYGLHFTGGEPFLNYDLLLELIRMATRFNIPSRFVETNCFWCKDEATTEKRLSELKKAGLDGILISVNPFILEYIPFARTEICVQVSARVFGDNIIIYQYQFYQIFQSMGIKGTMSTQQFFEKARASLSSVELLTMGRAVYKLKDLFYKYKPDHFFGHNCRDELFRNWHCHFDNYGNYIPGYCSGLSLGNINDATDLFGDLNLAQLPLIKALSTDIKILYEMAKNDFNYNEDPTGYISICHLCLDIRRTIIQKGHDFLELRPAVFYSSIE